VPVSFHQCTITIFIYKFSYQKEKKAEAREPFKMHFFFKLLALAGRALPLFRHERVQHSLFELEQRSSGL
jgi:hypothetical protein